MILVAGIARTTSSKTRKAQGRAAGGRGPASSVVTSVLRQRATAAQGDEHERTRRKILKAAHALYSVRGYASVSMREVAKRIGFSAQAIYYYFPSKEAMFSALADEGLRLLEAQHPSEELADPLDNLRLPFLRYYDFSKSHPEYFTLLWMDPAAATSQQEPQLAMIMRMTEDVNRRLRRCIDLGLMPADLDFLRAGEILLSAVHGPAVIGLTGRPPALNLDTTVRALLDSAMLGLQHGLVRQPPAEEAPDTAQSDGQNPGTSSITD